MCMEIFCEPADKIYRLTLIHLRLLMRVKMQKVNIANYEFISTCLFLRFSKGHFSMPCYMMLAWDESQKITHGWTKKSALLKPSIWQKVAKTWFKLVFWVKTISMQTCCRKVLSYVVCMVVVNLSSRRS